MSVTTTSTATTPSAAPLITAVDFVKTHAVDNVELVKGEVKESPMPFPKHGSICFKIGFVIGEHVLKNDLGHVMTNDSFVQTGKNPDTIRGADVCYFSYERLPKGAIPDGLLAVVPDLIVEVRSPSELWTDLFAKVVEYLKAGVRIVIVLDAKSASASVYRPDELQQIFHNGDKLLIPDLLPGFETPVQRLFG